MTLFELLAGGALLVGGIYIASRMMKSAPAVATPSAPAERAPSILPGPLPPWAPVDDGTAEPASEPPVEDTRAAGLRFRELLTEEEWYAWLRIPWMPDHSIARFVEREELDAFWDEHVSYAKSAEGIAYAQRIGWTDDSQILHYADEVWARIGE